MIKIKSHLTHLLIVNRTALKPGMNYIEDSNILQNRVFKKYIETGKVEVLNQDNNQDLDFTNMSTRELKKEIPEIYDYYLLKRMVEEDSRKTVKEEAEKQIERVKQGYQGGKKQVVTPVASQHEHLGHWR